MADAGGPTVEQLARRWVHAAEEDREGVRVYRSSDVPLPPARGRDEIELRADGTFVDLPIAAGDGNDSFEGTWTLQADGSSVSVTTAERGARTLRILLVAADRLEISTAT